MRVKSFIKHGVEWCPVEIELSFMPGLPQFQFLGLPDTALKESQWRIKTALKKQGFEWPKGRQIIVNMRPSNIRKSSQGLELAIACAFLWATEQVQKSPLLPEIPWVYGELSLEGDVIAPKDIYRAECELESEVLLTGQSDEDFPFSTAQIENLKSLETLYVNLSSGLEEKEEKKIPEVYFCKSAAQLLKVIATGEHNSLLVGPAGSGKTTVCEMISHLLKSSSQKDFREIKRWALMMNWPIQQRPFVMPHHSTPNISMIGGGSPPVPGEITRANKGVLVLDELLEFSSVVKESLREPIVSGKISVSRRGIKKEFPADFLLLATSNLCPCGNLVPGKFNSCRFSLIRCRSYTEKLSGPLADRFEILAFSHLWKSNQEVSLQEIYESVRNAQEFAKATRGQDMVNAKVPIKIIEDTMDPFLKSGGMPEISGSRRRYQAVMRVARSFADLESSECIRLKHIQLAIGYAVIPFAELQEIFA